MNIYPVCRGDFHHPRSQDGSIFWYDRDKLAMMQVNIIQILNTAQFAVSDIDEILFIDKLSQ
jgi:hypothetical protein